MGRTELAMLLALHKSVKDKTPSAFPLGPHACDVIHAGRVLSVVRGLRGHLVRNDCHAPTGECYFHVRKGVVTHIVFWNLRKFGIDILEALRVKPNELRRQIFFKRLDLFVLKCFRDNLLQGDDCCLFVCCLHLPGWCRCSKTTRNSRRQCHTTNNDLSFHD